MNENSSHEDDDSREDEYETAEIKNLQNNNTIVRKQKPKNDAPQTKARASITFALEDSKGAKKRVHWVIGHWKYRKSDQ